MRHDTGPLRSCRVPLSRCTVQVCSNQRAESSETMASLPVSFLVVQLRCTHNPERSVLIDVTRAQPPRQRCSQTVPLRDGRPTTLLGTCQCLPDPPPRQAAVPNTPRPAAAAVQNVFLVFSARRRLQLDSAHRRHQHLSLHRENRRCRVTRWPDFFRAEKEDVGVKEFSTTHFIVCGKTMLLARFIDSVVSCASETVAHSANRAEH